jgi:asparagine synthase (glutamine-hydrolysing)
LGHSLISKYVSQNTNVKILFSGEVMDEMGSYLYLTNAPNKIHFQNECISLLENIHYFDGLRSDRCISFYGLESRVPFCDKNFVKYYMSIDPKLRMFDDIKIEKYLLRKAFDDKKHLPDDVLWRRKNGFSDSVSNKNNSLSEIIKKHIDKIISDEEFSKNVNKYTKNIPYTKESYYYRKIYEKYYSNTDLTPYYWLPKWNDEKDPSARFLDSYKAD